MHLKRESMKDKYRENGFQTFAIIVFEISLTIEITECTTSSLNLIERRHVGRKDKGGMI